MSKGHEVVVFTDPTNPSHIVGVEIDGRAMRAFNASVAFGVDELTRVTVTLRAASVEFRPTASAEIDAPGFNRGDAS